MKIAKVFPLYKTGDRHNFSNYRPLSLLPQFPKILEKLFYNRLDKFLDGHKFISDSQYGFRPNSSTSMALIDLVEEITKARDKQFAVFIDLKKAFDTIDHNLLINKLELIRGGSIGLGKSLFKRQKTVCEVGGIFIFVLEHCLWHPSEVSTGSEVIFALYK